MSFSHIVAYNTPIDGYRSTGLPTAGLVSTLALITAQLC